MTKARIRLSEESNLDNHRIHDRHERGCKIGDKRRGHLLSESWPGLVSKNHGYLLFRHPERRQCSKLAYRGAEHFESR